jgi:hypothetical protein
MKAKTGLRVFIQEDDKALQKKIAAEFKDYNCVLNFFPKSESAFYLLNFNPDILIQDFATRKAVKCYQWSEPYNHWH